MVLRYFSMRHIDEYSGKLSEFMDLCLRQGNRYTDEQLKILRKIFEETIEKANMLFGEKHLPICKEKRHIFMDISTKNDI